MLKKIVSIVLLMVMVVGIGSCLKNDPTDSCKAPGCESDDPCAIKADSAEIAAVQNYLTANNIVATQHCSGIFYAVDDPGAGRTPSACSRVNMTYVGKILGGSQFDQGTADFCVLGLIRGMTNGLPLVKENGKVRLYIPPSLGYGSGTVGTIPGNSVLYFEVTLNKVY